MEERRKIKRTLKKIKGTVCINCHKDCQDNIEYHHVVPLCIGGNDIISNIVPLCKECHTAIHNTEESPLCIKNLVEAKKIIDENISIGRPKITKNELPKSFIDFYPLIKNKKKNITQAAKELHLSRTTIYKYIKLIEEGDKV